MSVHLKKRERIIKGGRGRAVRPKTFLTEEGAHTYAKKMGYAEYDVVNLKNDHASTKKLKVVLK